MAKRGPNSGMYGSLKYTYVFSFLSRQFTVRVGEWNLADEDNYSQELQVERFVAHPNFRPNGFYNDIAVFTLKRPISFSQ